MLSRSKLNRRLWAVVRRRVFERDGYRCRKCGKAGRLDCDHIKPLAFGGAAYDMGNLQALCKRCHIEKTKAEFNLDVEYRDEWAERVAKIRKGTR